MSSMRGSRAVVVLVVLVLATLVACGGGGRGQGISAPPRDTSDGGDGAAPPTTSGPAAVPRTVARSAPGVDLRVYFLRDRRIGTAHRRVPPTEAVGRAALEQLIGGPTAGERAAGLETVIGSDTRIRSLSISDGVATVELDPDVARGDDVTARLARAQVVFTLTQFPTVRSVRFGTTGSPVSRSDLADVTPAILVESVAPGDTVSSPVTVAGINNTFESTVRVAVLGADRRVLADTFTTGRGDVGTWGRFTVDVPFRTGGDATGFVVVWWDSPKDGSRVDVVEIPVRFG